MGKDDWPEGTEAGALIDEAYRKGWLPRDARPLQATCMHCGCTFPMSEGHVDDDIALCGLCLHKE